MSASSSDVIRDHDSVQACAAYLKCNAVLCFTLYMLNSYHEIGFALYACMHTGQIAYMLYWVLYSASCYVALIRVG